MPDHDLDRQSAGRLADAGRALAAFDAAMLVFDPAINPGERRLNAMAAAISALEPAGEADIERIRSVAGESRVVLVDKLFAAEAERDRLAADLKKLCDWVEHEVGVELPFDARAALEAKHDA